MIAALILAGGQGRRLGGADKALLRLGGQTLLAQVSAKLRAQMGAAPIALSANGELARFDSFPLPVLPDGPYAGAGPLAGVLAGLVWARSLGTASLVTMPVDTPFFPADFVARMAPSPAVAVWRGRQHHLAASWPVTALPRLRGLVEAPGAKRVRDALADLGARAVTFDAAAPDTAADPFLNINTPAELAAAEAVWRSSAGFAGPDAPDSGARKRLLF